MLLLDRVLGRTPWLIDWIPLPCLMMIEYRRSSNMSLPSDESCLRYWKSPVDVEIVIKDFLVRYCNHVEGKLA